MGVLDYIRSVWFDAKGNGTYTRPIGLEKLEADQHDLKYPFDEAYAKTSDVYSIVNNKIVKNALSIPWVPMIRKGDEEEPVTKGRFYDFVMNPNPEQSIQDFREQGLQQLMLGGTVFFYGSVPFGFTVVENGYQLHPQMTRIITKWEGMFNHVKGYEYRVGGKDFKILPELISLLKFANPSDFGINSQRGLAPVTAGYLTIEGLRGSQATHAGLLKNQVAAGIMSNESEYVMTPKDQERQQKLLDARLGVGEPGWAGKIIQSMAKVKYTKLGLDPTQLKIIEGKTLKLRDLCNIFDIKSELMNDPGTRSISNGYINKSERDMWKNAVLPNDEKYLKGFEKAYVKAWSKRDFPAGNAEYFIKQDTSNILALKQDEKTKAEKGKSTAEIITTILTAEISNEAKIQTLMRSLEIPRDEAEVFVSTDQN